MPGLTIRPHRPLDLRLTLGPFRRARADPTIRLSRDEAWRATRTPLGPATTHMRLLDGRLEVEAWGAGAEWALAQAPALVGEFDDQTAFRPAHPLLRELHRRFMGMRIPRSQAVFESVVPTVLEQKVAGQLARSAYGGLLLELGEPAPGPLPLLVPPAPAVLARTPYWLFHRYGVERRRAEIIRRAAVSARRLEEAVAMEPAAAQARIRAFPGLGAWSAAEVALIALGDADAVSVGDYHLPHQVSWALAGEPRGSDQRMLELLEPYRGQRGRVLRLLTVAGLSAPRFGPRLALRRIERE